MRTRRRKSNRLFCKFSRKTSPDFVHLEWEKPKEVHSADIQAYRLNSNGDTIAVLPSDINSFVVNDGELGGRYLFQIEVRKKLFRKK